MHCYCLVDGACPNNGRYTAEAFGSYAIYLTDEEVAVEDLINLTPLHHEEMFQIPLNGKRATNNAAEAMALLTLIMELKRRHLLGPQVKVFVYMDSQLTINHFYGLYRLRDQSLKQIHTLIKKELNGFRFTLDWISGDKMKGTIIGH